MPDVHRSDRWRDSTFGVVSCMRSSPIAKRFDRRINPLKLRLLLLFVSLHIIALSGALRSFAAEQPSDVPAWLRAHVGEGEGQIAQVVLQRARALYLKKVSE